MKIVKIPNFQINKTLTNIKCSNFFYTKEWLDITQKIFGLDYFFLKIFDEDKTYYFCFQYKDGKAYSSFIGYGGIISQTPIEMSRNLQLIKTLEKKYKVVFQRIKLFPKQQWTKIDKNFICDNTVIIPLKLNMESQEKVFHKSIRTAIKYAIKHNITVRQLIKDDIKDFYVFYKTTMERVHSEYLTSIELFEELTQINSCLFLGAFVKDQLIAGSIYLLCNEGVFYWWNSSDEEYRRLCPNHVLLYQAIKGAINSGATFFDMASSHSEAIERPKLRWSAIRSDLWIWDKS